MLKAAQSQLAEDGWIGTRCGCQDLEPFQILQGQYFDTNLISTSVELLNLMMVLESVTSVKVAGAYLEAGAGRQHRWQPPGPSEGLR